MQREVCKAYGTVSPVGEDALRATDAALRDWGVSSCLSLQGSMLVLSFEGVFFPLEDFLAALRPFLESDCTGRIDVFDLEGWRMTRARIGGTEIRLSHAGLNDVLSWSNH